MTFWTNTFAAGFVTAVAVETETGWLLGLAVANALCAIAVAVRPA